MLHRNTLCAVALVQLVACACSGGDSEFRKTANIAPTVAIVAPTEGAVFEEGQTIEFVGTAADGNGLEDIQTVVWSSDLQGEIGNSTVEDGGAIRLGASLEDGTHSVTVTVTDFEGEFTTDTVTVHVIGEVQPPSCLILKPGDNTTHLSDRPLSLEGRVSDLQQAPDSLTLAWKYVPAGGVSENIITTAQAEAGSGNVVSSWDVPELGAWIIQLEATDEDGNDCTDEIAVIIMHPSQADLDGDGYPGAQDCDDNEFDVNPGRNELCNNRDDNCSGQIDDKDRDGDGHIDMNCVDYMGLLPVDDCVDTNASIFLNAFELADNADNDCDGQVDEGTNLYDDDGDCACEHASICNGSINPVCVSRWGYDCDDTDPAMNQDDADFDNASTCDGDCDDGNSDLNLRDSDRDTYTTCDGDCNDFDPSLTPATCPENKKDATRVQPESECALGSSLGRCGMRHLSTLCSVVLVPLAACAPDYSPPPRQNYVPSVAIISPAQSAVFLESDAIELVGTTADANGLDDIQSVVWTSDLQGELGVSEVEATGGLRLVTSLQDGTHQVTVTVTDFGGALDTDTVGIHVIGEVQRPSCLLLRPGQNSQHLTDRPLMLEGRVNDLQQPPETLSVVWTYLPSGGVSENFITDAVPEPITGDVVSSWDPPLAGAWTVRLEVTDEDGNQCVDEVSLTAMHPHDADLDGDGYRGDLDCDDTNFNVNPGRNELCNGRDDNCSGQIDDKDYDRDGHVDMNCVLYTGLQPVDDCVDTNVSIHFGAFELADNADNDCDGLIDEGTNLFDDDGDCACEHASLCNGSINPACVTRWFRDCDDTDPTLNQDDADHDSATTCEGDCDDFDADLNLSDRDRDQYTTCDGDCNDFDPRLTPATCL